MLLFLCYVIYIIVSKFKNIINLFLFLVIYISIYVSLLNDFDVYFVI